MTLTFPRLVALIAMGSLVGCKTLPVNPGTYRADEAPLEGVPLSTPVALLVTAKQTPEMGFVSHHLAWQAGPLFPDRVVAFEEKGAQGRDVIAVEDVSARRISGFFNDDIEISVKGYVQKGGGTRIPVTITHMGSMDLSLVNKALWFAALALPIIGGFASFTYAFSWVGFGFLYLGMTASQTFSSNSQFELGEAMDRACSGAVGKFLIQARKAMEGAQPAVQAPPPAPVAAPTASAPPVDPAATAPAAAPAASPPAAATPATTKPSKPSKR
jgi:hypothetical protein